jgi:ABC-type Fe3+-hydroxamate transport system substrate-binding protein
MHFPAEFTDQMGHTVRLERQPQRIISLVPSQTELLAHLGLEKETIGITKFCIHPENWFRNKMRVGGTKQINFDQINTLQPDLIIGNKEENERAQIEQLAQRYPVWMSDISNLTQALDMIRKIGSITGKMEQADQLAGEIDKQFDELAAFTKSQSHVAYLIWKSPWMAASGNTFISDMLQRAGFTNVFQSLSRYPDLSDDQLAAANPEFIFLSSEPYPFKESHIQELQRICPRSKVYLVDGELFSWYGSRLLLTPDYLKSLRTVSNS